MEKAVTEATTTGKTIPILTPGKVIIRPNTLEDAQAMAIEANSTEVAQFMRNRFPSPYSLDDAVWWLTTSSELNPRMTYGICKPDNTFIGNIGLIPGSDTEYRTFEIGYWIGPSHWGHGYATDALIAFSKAAFENFPLLLRLEAGVYSLNPGSTRVLEKAGYTYEGRKRNAVEKKGKVMDILLYSLLREECLGESAAAV